MEGKPDQKDVFRRLLKVALAVEGADRTKRGSLFHRVGPQKQKALVPVLQQPKYTKSPCTLGTEQLA